MFDNIINSWALGDFAIHFPQCLVWSGSSVWEFSLVKRSISAYHYSTNTQILFEGDGIVAVVRDGHRICFDSHSQGNSVNGAFVKWVDKKFPTLNIF